MPSEYKNLQYREPETRYVLSKLNTGSSVALVGVGSVGKSNFLRHVLHPEVQRTYLGPESEGLHMVYIDPNNMLDSLPPVSGTDRPTSWAGYEIMLHRLYRYFQPHFSKYPDSVQNTLYEVYQNLQDGRNPLTAHVALRNLEYGIDLMIAQGTRLVFIFDEFEEMFKELPPKFFRTLRGLRDDYKYQLMYMTVTRKPMPDLIMEHGYDYDALEPFIELFSDTTRFISAYGMRDALVMMRQLAERNNIAYPDRIQELLIKVSGGHGGLMRAAFSVGTDLTEGMNEDDAAEGLARYRPVQAESHSIWLSLNPNEQEILVQLMAGKRDKVNPRSVDVRNLLEKQLLQKGGDVLIVAPPLFRSYLKTQVSGR